MTVLSQIVVFEEIKIRMVGTIDCPEWVAKDVADVLGIQNVRDAVSDYADDEKGVVIDDTLGGRQQMLTLKEPGLYRMLATTRKPNTERFRRWVFHEVLPSIRKTGGYSLEMKASTPAEIMIQQAKMMVVVCEQMAHAQQTAQEAKQLAQDVQEDVRQLKEQQAEATRDLEYIPLAQEPAKQRSQRSLVVELVRKYAIAKGVDHATVWTVAYTDFKHRYQFDAWRRSKNKGKGCKPLDVIEQEGLMEEFYKLVSEKFQVQIAPLKFD